MERDYLKETLPPKKTKDKGGKNTKEKTGTKRGLKQERWQRRRAEVSSRGGETLS